MVSFRPLDLLLLSVAVPPYLSLLYALAVQVFLAFPRECPWTAHSRHIGLRTAWVCASSAACGGLRHRTTGLGRGGDDGIVEVGWDDKSAVFAAIASVVVSVYLIHRTRTDQIQGPRPLHLTSSSQSMWGRVVVITGANSGIGRETARQLHGAGATVIMACRNEGRCREAMDDIMGSSSTSSTSRTNAISSGGVAGPGKDCSNGSCDGHSGSKCVGGDENLSNRLLYLPLDLSCLDSVRSAASQFRSLNLPLHVLINNAGLMMPSRKISEDGFEMTMAANHLGHFLLTLELLPLLMKEADRDEGGDARVVTVSSSTYALSSNGIEFDDLHCERREYGLFAQYSQSKLANVLFGRELARREAERVKAGSELKIGARQPVASHIVHPGLVRTDVVRNMPWYLYYPNIIFGFAVGALQKTPEAGAYTSVYCASSPDLKGRSAKSGSYYVNSKEERLEKCALDDDAGRRLWEDSEKMVGWRSAAVQD